MFEDVKKACLTVLEHEDYPPRNLPVQRVKFIREKLNCGLYDAKRLMEAHNEGRLDDLIQRSIDNPRLEL